MKEGRFRAWLNKRLPVDQFMEDQLTGYYAPKNFNIWYFFGSLALLVFVMQIVTGIFVTMHFKPGEATAWDSVQYMVREVPYMWLIQPMHAVGASFFFIVVYLHMARGLMYGSYKAPRELLWVIGMLIYLALMAEAFMGYVLPYGNMSYWGAQVIINIFGTIPASVSLIDWIRGDYGIGDATLTRFFSLHVSRCRSSSRCWWRCTWWLCARSAPTIRTASRSRKSWARTASRSTASRSIPTTRSRTSSAWPVPHAVRHRGVLRADLRRPVHGSAELRTGEPGVDARHIAPVWYFTPYYAILRAVPDQKLGALLMALAVVAFLFLPWLDRAKNKSIRYRGLPRRSCSACSSSRSWC